MICISLYFLTPRVSRWLPCCSLRVIFICIPPSPFPPHQPQHSSYLWQTAVAAAARQPDLLEGQPSHREDQPADPLTLCLILVSSLSRCPGCRLHHLFPSAPELNLIMFYIDQKKIKMYGDPLLLHLKRCLL